MHHFDATERDRTSGCSFVPRNSIGTCNSSGPDKAISRTLGKFLPINTRARLHRDDPLSQPSGGLLVTLPERRMASNFL